MTFTGDPTDVRDRIRMLCNDASNDAATEVYSDDTYDRAIDLYVNWKRAAVFMLNSVAAVYDGRPSGLTAQGDGSINWQERAKQLRVSAAQLQKEADAEDAADAAGDGAGKLVTFTADFLTGGAG